MADKLVFVLVSLAQEFSSVLFTAMSMGLFQLPSELHLPRAQGYLLPVFLGDRPDPISSFRCLFQVTVVRQSVCISSSYQKMAVCSLIWSQGGVRFPWSRSRWLEGSYRYQVNCLRLTQLLARERILCQSSPEILESLSLFFLLDSELAGNP